MDRLFKKVTGLTINEATVIFLIGLAVAILADIIM